MKPATRLTLFAVVVLAAILLWSTLAGAEVEVHVCVGYRNATELRARIRRNGKGGGQVRADHGVRADRARDGPVDRVRQRSAGERGLHREERDASSRGERRGTRNTATRDPAYRCALTPVRRGVGSERIPDAAACNSAHDVLLLSPARPGPM